MGACIDVRGCPGNGVRPQNPTLAAHHRRRRVAPVRATDDPPPRKTLGAAAQVFRLYRLSRVARISVGPRRQTRGPAAAAARALPQGEEGGQRVRAGGVLAGGGGGSGRRARPRCRVAGLVGKARARARGGAVAGLPGKSAWAPAWLGARPFRGARGRRAARGTRPPDDLQVVARGEAPGRRGAPGRAAAGRVAAGRAPASPPRSGSAPERQGPGRLAPCPCPKTL
jgi:hypothetical protein